MEENKDIKEEREELERISQDDILRRRALKRTIEIADQYQFKKDAIEEGERKAKAEIIKELYKTNMPIEQIASIVKLEEAEVKEVLNIK